MVEETEVKVYKVKYRCEECGGYMEPTGIALMTNPPQYPHKCDKCGYEQTFWESYPRIIYKEITA